MKSLMNKLDTLTKQHTILIHPDTYKKYKYKIDKIGCKVIQANFVFKDEWRIIDNEE